MKKLLALVLCAVMVLAMIPAVTLTASAAGEGDWTTRRSPKDYDDPDDYCPAGGFYYDSEGFHTTSPSFKNMNPFYVVGSKETFNMKEGFSMKVRIDEFSYKGEDGQADEWISFIIADNQNVTPGGSTHGFGSGWVSLNRGTGDGNPSCESFWSHEKDAEGNGAAFAHQGNTNGACELDAQGREIYTLTVTWDGSAYDIKVNGQTIAGCATISQNLNGLVESGDFYVNIVFHSGVSDGVAALTILEVNGSAPTGTEKKDPEDNVKVFGEMIDSSTVPANQPALLFDATKSSFNKDPEVQNTKVEAKGDNSYALTPSVAATFLSWSIKSKLTYNATDFPVFAMLLRNSDSLSGGLYYLSGENMSAGPTTLTSWDAYGEDCVEDTVGDDYYNLIVVNLGEKNDDGTPMYNFKDRINGFRIDFGGLSVDETFDICYMGTFRSVEEAVNYKNTYLKIDPTQTESATETQTSKTEESNTQAPGTATSTEAVVTGNATGTNATDASATEKASGSGCASVIGGASAVVMAAVAAAVALKKKH